MGSLLASESRTRCSVRLRPGPQICRRGIDANNYLVAVDADIIRDADKFKMDLIGGLERTLHGQVKPSMPLSTPPSRAEFEDCD